MFTVKLFYILGLIAFYVALRFTGISEKYRFWLACALGFSSLYFPWSTVFNNHSLAASFLAIGYLYILKAKYESARGTFIFLAAFFLSLAGITDVPIAIFYGGFLLFLLTHAELRGKLHYYLFPLLITALPAIYINYVISGSVFPVAMHKEFFDYPGSFWIKSGGLSGTDKNSWHFALGYGLSALFGPRGFILYNPLLLIALPCLVAAMKPGRAFRMEALTIGLCSILLASYYFIMTNNYGGSCYSIRWFVPLLPLIFFFSYAYFEKITARRQRLFFALFVIAGVIAVIGVVNPYSRMSLSPFPIIANIRHYAYFLNSGLLFLFSHLF